MPEGRVLELWRWPVKSMGGERIRSTRVDARGAGGDRTHAVLHEHQGAWKPLTVARGAAAAGVARELPVRRGRRPATGEPAVRARPCAGRAPRVHVGRPATAGHAGRRPRLLGPAPARRRRHPGPRAHRADHRRGDARRPVLRLLHPCVRCAIPTRDPDTQEKWPQLLRHLDRRHGTPFGVNARVLQAGRIAADEPVSIHT